MIRTVLTAALLLTATPAFAAVDRDTAVTTLAALYYSADACNLSISRSKVDDYRDANTPSGDALFNVDVFRATQKLYTDHKDWTKEQLAPTARPRSRRPRPSASRCDRSGGKGAGFQGAARTQKLFVIPNPWDGASAKLLASQGFEALTTTSAGLAFVARQADGGVTREQSLWNAKLIVDSVDLPVAADLENGFGHARGCRRDNPAGGSGRPRRRLDRGRDGDAAKPIYDFNQAVERVAAAAEAALKLAFPFVFVARAENYLHGGPASTNDQAAAGVREGWR